MTRVLVVDWLGRGGIAQTTQSWAVELARAGVEVRIVSRRGRELEAGPWIEAGASVVGPPDAGGALLSHRRVAHAAVAEIRSWRPDVVVVQNYVVPLLEEPVHRAARRAGARVVLVLHDHRHHGRDEGNHLGLRRQIAAADALVVHSADATRHLGRDAVLVPHPVQVDATDPAPSPVRRRDGRLLALCFGVLNRSYKGTDLAVELATTGVPGWEVAFVGVGAPSVPGAQSVDRFVTAGELAAAVRTADVALLPYRSATQSGAVVLAQRCGTVPVASAVGGVVEQIDDGVTGVLVPAGAGVDGWAAALARLADDDLRARLGRQARQHLHRQHAAFRAGVLSVVGVPSDTPVPDGPRPSRSVRP